MIRTILATLAFVTVLAIIPAAHAQSPDLYDAHGTFIGTAFDRQFAFPAGPTGWELFVTMRVGQHPFFVLVSSSHIMPTTDGLYFTDLRCKTAPYILNGDGFGLLAAVTGSTIWIATDHDVPKNTVMRSVLRSNGFCQPAAVGPRMVSPAYAAIDLSAFVPPFVLR